MTKQSHKHKPVLAVTMGEPGGIGPEIVAKLFESYRPARSSVVIVGGLPVLESCRRGLARHIEILSSETLNTGVQLPQVSFLDTGCRARYATGKDSRGGGRHAGMALDLACRLASEGVVQAIVTAPLSKKSLDLAGYRFAGHTEFLARYFGAPDCQMMMVYKGFRVVPLTRHIPVKKISRLLSKGRVLTGLTVVHNALRSQFGVTEPRIAIAGLNPHAGEAGILGTEDLEVIRPAVRAARRRGIDAVGPLPADSMFQQAQSGTFDAFMAMYHDQGLIPFKMVAKRRGVNVTVGLPIVRTSVDHGVAYDAVGAGTASFISLREAYQLAERMVVRGRMRTD